MTLAPTGQNETSPVRLPLWTDCQAVAFLDVEPAAFGAAADLIVSAESLITLEGRRFQHKRSLIRQFEAACGGWGFREISPKNIDEAFEVERLWQREEAQGAFVRRCFRDYREQELLGGILYADTTPLGYAMAAPCGEEGAVLLLLRARPTPAGASAMLYRQMALLLQARLPRLAWINLGRGGSPAEQQNRSSYHPQGRLDHENGRNQDPGAPRKGGGAAPSQAAAAPCPAGEAQ